MTQPKAFLFDLNGTIIDDMEYHATAWYDILNNKLQAGVSRDEVKSQMYGKNAEVLDRILGPGRFTPQQVDELEMEKEKSYQQAFKPHLRAISGFEKFVAQADAHGVTMAIGSAAIPFNIDFVLDGLGLRKYFPVVVSATDVSVSKPHPETFLKAAALLGVAPTNCVVFEDAPKGVEAAANAGMACVVITTMHTAEEFSHFNNVLFFIKDYHDDQLLTLLT